jgi:hypothetical protein
VNYLAWVAGRSPGRWPSHAEQVLAACRVGVEQTMVNNYYVVMRR